MASSSSDEKTIKLVSSDGKHFEVDQTTAIQSQTIRHIVEDDRTGNAIPLPNVTGKVLAKVVEYLKRHGESSGNVDDDDDGLKSWDVEFMKIGTDELYDLLLAANYLDVKGLLDLACQTAADMVKGKTPDEIRNTFKIKNDFSPEEEEEIRRENSWAFE